MAFVATRIYEANGARTSNPTLGGYCVEIYSFTQLSSDTGGTITTQMGEPLLALVSGNTASASAVGTSISAQVVTVVTTGTAPTAGYVLVIGKQR